MKLAEWCHENEIVLQNPTAKSDMFFLVFKHLLGAWAVLCICCSMVGLFLCRIGSCSSSAFPAF